MNTDTHKMDAGNAPRVTYHGTKLTAAQWKELEFTGCVVAGDRIIRTLAFIKRGRENADKEIKRQAKKLGII